MDTAVIRKRFAQGARERFSGTFYDKSQALGGSAVQLDLADFPAGDFTAGVYLQVTGTTAANAAVVTFAADGPWNALQEIQLLDPQGQPFQIYSGYELYILNMLGGFVGNADQVVGPTFSTTTGGGGTGGSFAFILRVPAELFPRDMMGVLFNGSSASQFRLKITLAPSASVYGTAPTTPPTVRVRLNTHGYVVPFPTSLGGQPYPDQPPGGQSYNAWQRQIFNVASGNQTIPLTIGKGFAFRLVVGLFRDNTGARVNTLVTGDTVFRIDNVEHFNGTYEMLRQITFERGKPSAGNGVANLPAGVVILGSFCHEWDGFTGHETRDMWVPTQAGSIVDVRTTVGATGTLTVLANVVALTADAVAMGLTP